jgi:hypothetical protein
MSDLTGSLVDICDYLFNLLDTNRSLLGLEGVYYGDQELLPATPTACVDPGEKPRGLKGAQRMSRVEFRVYILVYHSKVQATSVNRRDADIMAEAIETLIHTKRSLDGLVIDGMITNVSSGYMARGNTFICSSRLTYEAQSQQLLPHTG